MESNAKTNMIPKFINAQSIKKLIEHILYFVYKYFFLIFEKKLCKNVRLKVKKIQKLIYTLKCMEKHSK